MSLFRYSTVMMVITALLKAGMTAAICEEFISNGNFETGAFTPWIVTTSDACRVTLNTGSFSPPSGSGPTVPIEGQYDALTYQSGPGLCTIKQMVNLPPISTITSATLSWKDSIRNDAGTFSDPNQEARVLVCVEGMGGGMEEVWSTQPGDIPSQVGPNTRSFNILGILQTLNEDVVNIRLDEQDNLGFFSMNWDVVSLRICHDDPNNGCEQPGACADPHFTTWSNEHFDFQGECDLVMVDNPNFKNGLGMHIHARTTLHGTWSAISSAVIKIGDDILEVHGEAPPLINGVIFHLDVEDGNEFAFPMFMGGYSLTVQQRGPHSRRFIIHLGEGERIFINNFKEFVDVEIESPRAEEFTGSVGLLGSYTTGSKLSRDGKTVMEDADAFGQEWQVRDTDPQLFSVIDGPQYPAKCNMPEELSAEQRRLRNLTRKVSPEDAEKACAKVTPHSKFNCVADVLASDNLDIVGVYTGGSV